MPIPSETIIVAGSGRSGTTWLGNIIAGDDIKILFEPFDCRKVSEVAGLGLRPYFDPTREYRHWHPVIDKILSGDIHNSWVDQDVNRLAPQKYSNRVLIKEIRINGMLGWIDKNFQCKIVYLIRNPYEVVFSRINSGWDSHIASYMQQPNLVEKYLKPFIEVIHSARSECQKHAVMWCIENLVPLSQIKYHDWCICFYKQLCLNPESEIIRILKYLHLDLTQERKAAVIEQSRTSLNVNSGNEYKFDSISLKHMKYEIKKILDVFGIIITEDGYIYLERKA